MRTRILTIAAGLFLLAAPLWAASDPANDDQKTLYALGLALSQSIGTFSLTEAELDMVKSGMTDGVLKRSPKVDLQTFGPKIQHLQQARALSSPVHSGAAQSAPAGCAQCGYL